MSERRGERERRLSFLDRYLTLWIVLAMLLGVGLGALRIQLPAIVVPIGLVVMVYLQSQGSRVGGRSPIA